MTEINGEEVLWWNRYLNLAITTTPCEVCGGDVNFYYLHSPAKKVATFCSHDMGEMLPALSEYVEKMRVEDAPTRAADKLVTEAICGKSIEAILAEQAIKKAEREVVEAAVALVEYEAEADRLRKLTPEREGFPGSAETTSPYWQAFCRLVEQSTNNLDFRAAVHKLIAARAAAPSVKE